MLAETVVDRLGHLVLDPSDGKRSGIPAGPLALRRAWPGGPGRLLLEYEAADGSLLAGQWFAKAPALEQVASEMASVAPADVAIATGGEARVLLQARGADRRLPGLRPLVARPDATLVSHRPERRALVRLRDRGYAKVVLPERVTAVLAALERAALLAGASFDVPSIVEVDESAGVIVMNALTGVPLGELLEDGRRIVRAARAVGRALSALHASPAPQSGRRHGPLEEAAVVGEWLESAAAHLPGVAASIEREARPVLEALGRLPASAPGPLHRDFHDKQSMVAGDGRVGLLDFDTLASGDVAVDLANLLVHLELRWLQGRCSEARTERAARALLEGYGPGPGTTGRLRPYADATRIRLACVYAFRPAWADVPVRLLARLGRVPAIS